MSGNGRNRRAKQPVSTDLSIDLCPLRYGIWLSGIIIRMLWALFSFATIRIVLSERPAIREVNVLDGMNLYPEALQLLEECRNTYPSLPENSVLTQLKSEPDQEKRR